VRNYCHCAMFERIDSEAHFLTSQVDSAEQHGGGKLENSPIFLNGGR